MIVSYKDKYMERLCTDYKFAIRETNKVMAKSLQYCDQALKTYDSVETLIGLKIRQTHPLHEYKAGNFYSMHLTANYRLIFEKVFDDEEYRVVRIDEITDYH